MDAYLAGKVVNQTKFRGLIGSLMYLTTSRLDIIQHHLRTISQRSLLPTNYYPLIFITYQLLPLISITYQLLPTDLYYIPIIIYRSLLPTNY